jgi:hypothetical protein
MSRLYVKVLTGFYAHRKTLRLRAALGDDAFWISSMGFIASCWLGASIARCGELSRRAGQTF